MADNSSTISGALGGAATGAEIGTAILPGVGTVVGALGGALLGGIGGSKKQKAVDDAMAAIEAIPAVDPNMVEFKDQLTREKRSVESGFNTEFQVARDLIGQSEAGGMTVAAELAQTNPALALMMMSQVSNQADVSANKALGTIGTKSMGYTQMLGDLVEKMSQREIDVNMMKAEYKMAQAQASKKDFNANAMALIAKYGPGVLDKLGDIKFGNKLATKADNYDILNNLETGNFYNDIGPSPTLIPET
jgi:hypothetical protein